MRRPEILAPAGDRDALAAALAAGADAVYFGLDDGFNARARAANFPSTDSPSSSRWSTAPARAPTSRSTRWCSSPSSPVVEELLRRVAAAGVDAIIVQDPAVALLARAICARQLEVHASTQMTASSPLAVGAARAARPVARRRAARAVGRRDPRVPRGHRRSSSRCSSTARCAWRGAASACRREAWGGRSANRGQCAQACRLPYELVVDGEARDLGEVAYLLSPKDLAGARRGAGARRDRRREPQDRGPAQGPGVRRDRGRAVPAARGGAASASRADAAGRRPARSRGARRSRTAAASRPASSPAPITRRSSRAGSRATAACRSAA